VNAKKPFSRYRSSHAARCTSQEGGRPAPEHWSGPATSPNASIRSRPQRDTLIARKGMQLSDGTRRKPTRLPERFTVAFQAEHAERPGGSCDAFVAHKNEERCPASVSQLQPTAHETADCQPSKRVSVALIIRRSSVQIRDLLASSTAAKYSSGAALQRFRDTPDAALACSTPVPCDRLARGSERRGPVLPGSTPRWPHQPSTRPQAASLKTSPTPVPEGSQSSRPSGGRLRAKRHADRWQTTEGVVAGQGLSAPTRTKRFEHV
jgi:hypothetical protein